eukprot:5326011-Amphidinium_carterae.1
MEGNIDLHSIWEIAMLVLWYGIVVHPFLLSEAIDRAHLGPVAYPEKAFGEAVLHRADLYHGVK